MSLSGAEDGHFFFLSWPVPNKVNLLAGVEKKILRREIFPWDYRLYKTMAPNSDFEVFFTKNK